LSGTTRVSRYQKGKTNLDLLEQETVRGSGISWAIYKSAPRPRQLGFKSGLLGGHVWFDEGDILTPQVRIGVPSRVTSLIRSIIGRMMHA